MSRGRHSKGSAGVSAAGMFRPPSLPRLWGLPGDPQLSWIGDRKMDGPGQHKGATWELAVGCSRVLPARSSPAFRGRRMRGSRLLRFASGRTPASETCPPPADASLLSRETAPRALFAARLPCAANCAKLSASAAPRWVSLTSLGGGDWALQCPTTPPAVNLQDRRFLNGTHWAFSIWGRCPSLFSSSHRFRRASSS